MPSDPSTTHDQLNQALHPEWIQRRREPCGRTQVYLPDNHAITLANTMFGHDGWTMETIQTNVDFCDVSDDGSVMVGMVATVRVTLVSGCFHEDLGYGTEHDTVPSVAYDKARCAATVDGFKRALRKFGNAMGNCLYDTRYLHHIMTPPVQAMTSIPAPSTDRPALEKQDSYPFDDLDDQWFMQMTEP